MKKTILLTLISSFIFCFFALAQSGTYKSKSGEGCYAIDIRMEGTVAYYKIYPIEYDNKIGSGFYMLADIMLDEKGTFDIPDHGRNCWLIPFDGKDPVTLYNCTTGTASCDCYAGNGGCSRSGVFCHNAGCHECNMGCRAGGGGYEIVVNGGSIFLSASAVRREE